jgi:hypothetical protein
MPREVGNCSTLVTFLPVSGCCAAAVAQTPVHHVAARMNDAGVTTLLGNARPNGTGEFDCGVVSAAIVTCGWQRR